MLTPEQLALREGAVGASEVAAILEISPWSSPVDVWLTKRTATKPPLPSVGNFEMGVGNALEDGLRRLASERLGIEFRRCRRTLRHPEHPHVVATPDGLSARTGERVGIEIKVVGAHLAHHWANGVPEYVRVQCAMGMAVTGRGAWIVAALLDGTDFRLERVERDVDEDAALCEAVEAWWERHVDGDEPPEAMDADELRRLVDLRYPRPNGKIVARVEDAGVAEAMRWLAWGKRQRDAIGEGIGRIEAMLLERIGESYGIESEAGRLLWFERLGSINWQAVAAELGSTPDLEEKHRRPSFRVPKFTEAKPPKGLQR